MASVFFVPAGFLENDLLFFLNALVASIFVLSLNLAGALR